MRPRRIWIRNAQHVVTPRAVRHGTRVPEKPVTLRNGRTVEAVLAAMRAKEVLAAGAVAVIVVADAGDKQSRVVPEILKGDNDCARSSK